MNISDILKLFQQIPSYDFKNGDEISGADAEAAAGDMVVEIQRKYKLDDLPEVLELTTEKSAWKFMLQGAIIFQPPNATIEHHFADVGHYKCCVKINDSWGLFDDMDKNAKTLNKNTEVVIQSLFYVRIK